MYRNERASDSTPPVLPVKAAGARKEDLESQGQASAALVERLRMELEENRKVLSDLQASRPRVHKRLFFPPRGSHSFLPSFVASDSPRV